MRTRPAPKSPRPPAAHPPKNLLAGGGSLLHADWGLWDGWSLRKYSPDGVLLNEVAVPFPRPTSCLCLGNDRNR